MELTYFPDITLMTELNINTRAFREFEESLDELTFICDPELHLEAVNTMDGKAKRWLKDAGRSTLKTTGDVAEIYTGTVDASASVIKSAWNLAVRCLRLVVKVIDKVLRWIAKIPELIMDLMDKIGAIPDVIRAKIRGDIKLYITIDDLNNLYQNQLLFKLDNFIGLSKILIQGKTWGTLFHKRVTSENGITIPTNDMAICRKMDAIYKQLANTKFTQTIISMDNSGNREIYFGNHKAISISADLQGNRHNCSYLEGLKVLVEDLNTRKDVLKELKDSIGEKYGESQLNKSFARLHGLSQNRVAETIRIMSSMISIVGNIVRYVNIDIKTIQKAAEAIEKRMADENTQDGNQNNNQGNEKEANKKKKGKQVPPEESTK